MKKTLIAMVSLLLVVGACWADDTETDANEVKYYDNAKIVRIKSVEGEGFVQRSFDEGNEEATANLPVFEKDTVGTTDGRLTVYLGRVNYLRLDNDTIIVLEKIPQLRQTDATMRLEQGNIYMDIENLDREKSIEIQTPDCGIFLLDKGIYRVNTDQDGRTEVFVIEGIAEVSGRESSRDVRENQKIVMKEGEVEERPYYFYTSEKDDFDRWNEDQNRELGYARYSTSRYLQSGYEDVEYELSHAGRWSYMSDFNTYAWIPYYSNSDWRPYSNGRWVWHPYYGYVWTSYDNCGWFTHHYGRWHWDYAQGWFWLPAYHWSPAWVSWFWDDNYYGWCPLSWWNRPIIIINNHWDRNYDYHHGIPPHSRSTIVIRKNELAASNIHRIVINKNTLGQKTGSPIAYRGKAPIERPALDKVTVINAKGKAVIYKQGGIVNTDKYRAQGSDIRTSVYRYEPSTHHEESASTTRKNSNESGSPYFRSRTGGESSSGSRARTSSSASSTGKSSGKTVSYRSRTGSTSKKSSSSDSSGSTAKKKKDEPSYSSYNGSGYSSGATEAAAPTARFQSRSGSSGESSRYSYRSYGSAFSTRGGSSDHASSAALGSSQFFSRRQDQNDNPGLATSGRITYRSSRSGNDGDTGSSSSYKSSMSNGSSSRSIKSSSSSTYSSSRSSTSSSSHRASSSSASHSSSTTAAKKKD